MPDALDMSKRYTKHKICRKSRNMAQKTAKPRFESAILSVSSQFHTMAWHKNRAHIWDTNKKDAKHFVGIPIFLKILTFNASLPESLRLLRAFHTHRHPSKLSRSPHRRHSPSRGPPPRFHRPKSTALNSCLSNYGLAKLSRH